MFSTMRGLTFKMFIWLHGVLVAARETSILLWYAVDDFIVMFEVKVLTSFFFFFVVDFVIH